ncbi:MAG: tripartite tricarboxylate transporter substrate binding protein [Betaproteobacteria bacterium]
MKTIQCAALALVVGATTVQAQEYPAKTVRMIVPFAPGGATDVLARIVSQKLYERWGQIVIVDNRVGASGNIGAEYVAKSVAPDGYTLLVAGSPHAINMSLFNNLRYDLARDVAPITSIAAFPSLIAVHPSVPVKSVKDLIALARSRPGQINFGSAGNGSPNHLSMEMFKTMAKVDMTHIPYKGGSGQMVSDLLAGQVQLASMGLPPAMPYVKSGRLRVIAVTSAKRSPLLPQAPTVAETGLPGYEVNSWYGVFAPPALPKEIIAKINADIVTVLGLADVKERLAGLGAEPQPMTPDDFGKFVSDDIAKWSKVVKESGAKID